MGLDLEVDDQDVRHYCFMITPQADGGGVYVNSHSANITVAPEKLNTVDDDGDGFKYCAIAVESK